MQWLDQLPFADNRVLQIGLLAACGIAALVVLAILYRFVFAHRLRVPGGRTRQPRLGLVDAFSLDGQRQLVLIRRDNVEHLVMIGGPNDVLIEPQINRAMVPARESNQPSPLLAPGASGRRTEMAAVAAPVVAEAPQAKLAAPAPAPLPASPPAPAPAPAPANGIARAPSGPAVAAAAKPIEQEQKRAVSAPPAPPAQSAEPARPAPANAPPRPQPSRAGMPPPIAPSSGSASRATITRLPEKAPAKAPLAASDSPAPASAVPAPASRSEKTDASAAVMKAEPRATPAPVIASAAGAASSQSQPAKAESSAPAAPDAARQSGDIRAPSPKPNPSPNVKPAPKAEDPFADLQSLEAEMARLLGREKPS